MSPRVAITGCGVVSSLGTSLSALHEALCAGQSGICDIDLFETAELSCSIGGQVPNFDPSEFLGDRNLRPLDRTGRLATVAASLALDDSGWGDEERSSHEVGLVLGTMYGGVRTIAEFDRRAVQAGPNYASPMDFANSVINAPAGQAAIWHGLRGVNSTIASAQVSSLKALAYAAGLIRTGRSQVVLAGGAEELCFESFVSFERSGEMCSTTAGATPMAIPFDGRRNGFVLGEGAALLVLENLESARRRGARVLAEIRGAGVGFDPERGATETGAQGATVRALEAALSEAGLEPAEIGAVSASANGGADDILEGIALSKVFADTATRLPVTAIKSALGELLGASGGMQAVAALGAMADGRLPGVVGLEKVDERCALPMLTSATRDIEGRSILLNAVGQDGHRCAVVLSPAVP